MDQQVHRAFVAPHTKLGESPLYRAEDATLHYIDVLGRAIHILKLDGSLQRKTIECPEPITFLCFHREGGYVVCSFSSIVRVSDEGEWSVMKHILADTTDVRLNDAGIDSEGRLWVGGFDRVGEQVSRALDPLESFSNGILGLYLSLLPYRLRIIKDGGVIGGNGLCWSPDNTQMYFVDSKLNCIWAYDYEATSGRISNRRVVVTRISQEGEADGLLTDCDNNLYTFSWGGSDVVKYSSEGKLLRRWKINAARVTHGAWVGDKFNDLVVTSALQDDGSVAWDGEEAGGLFYLRDCGSPGIMKHRFG